MTVFSTSEKKKAEALKTLGADHFIVSKDKEQMEVRPHTLLYDDLIINPSCHALTPVPYLSRQQLPAHMP